MSTQLESLYRMIRAGRFDSKHHFFHSDVYYVRAAMRERTGIEFPLADVEKAMIDQGHRFSDPQFDPAEPAPPVLPLGQIDPS